MLRENQPVSWKFYKAFAETVLSGQQAPENLATCGSVLQGKGGERSESLGQHSL